MQWTQMDSEQARPDTVSQSMRRFIALHPSYTRFTPHTTVLETQTKSVFVPLEKSRIILHPPLEFPPPVLKTLQRDDLDPIGRVPGKAREKVECIFDDALRQQSGVWHSGLGAILLLLELCHLGLNVLDRLD